MLFGNVNDNGNKYHVFDLHEKQLFGICKVNIILKISYKLVVVFFSENFLLLKVIETIFLGSQNNAGNFSD